MAGNKSTNGSNIEKRRHELGMSQGQLAKLMNISVGQISRWELGGCVPHVDTLKKWQKYWIVIGKALLVDVRFLPSIFLC